MKTYGQTWLKEEWERMGRPDVEYLYCDGQETPVWLFEKDPVFYDDVQYRIKSKPWIDWDHVHESVIAMATNKNGGTKLYAHAPSQEFKIGQKIWHADSLPLGEADIVSSFTPGTCDWRDSLVIRPVFVGE